MKIRCARKDNRRGMLTVEYAFFVAILVAALIGMSLYLMRSLCGAWRGVGDAFGHGRQYQSGTTR